MWRAATIAALLLCGCQEKPVPSTDVRAIVVSTSDGLLPKTYLLDMHGHRGRVSGLWGESGDMLDVRCRDYGTDVVLEMGG